MNVYMLASYNPLVVAGSFAIAMLASYVTLDLAARVRTEQHRVGSAWWLAGSIVMGTGIWAMHFLGMQAFQLPIAIGFGGWMTLLSWLAAVCASGVALELASRPAFGHNQLALGALCMGTGISSMHYIGMAAIDLAPGIVWDYTLVALSVLIAIVASASALQIFKWLRMVKPNQRRPYQLAASLVMAIAICGMHYTGMAGASFEVGSVCLSAGELGGKELTALVLIATGMLLVSTLFSALIDARLQEAKQHTIELQAINTELDAFSYAVAHDLRTPLRSIAGFVSILGEEHAEQLDDVGKDYLKRVQESTTRMGELIDDLLKLSHISRKDMHLETVDLSGIAHEVLARLQQAEPERQVKLHIEESLMAKGDAKLLRIVLENLFGNAWKFTSKTAHPHISFTSARNHDTHDAAASPAFAISDNGAGFDMAYASKLFGVFQRLHAHSDFSGTGIGLATVHRILTRHGGGIQAKAQPGQGATFVFCLEGNVSPRTLASVAPAFCELNAVRNNPPPTHQPEPPSRAFPAPAPSISATPHLPSAPWRT